MAAAVDRRFDGVSSYPQSTMASAPAPMGMNQQTVVQDTYGGWMTRAKRALVFGLIGWAITLGTFLPGIIMVGMNWTDSSDSGIRGACTNDAVVRSLITSCFFIFHSLLVIPMFILGDRAHSVSTQSGFGHSLRSFWVSRLAHTAAVLQVVGNLIELALLIWWADAFWGDGVGTGSNSCGDNYSEWRNWAWAGLIIGFVAATVSLLTIRQQYTSAALRPVSGYAKGQHGALQAAP